MYGTQTYDYLFSGLVEFENDVKMYGTQTEERRYFVEVWFENDVKMYGTQTTAGLQEAPGRLRMM